MKILFLNVWDGKIKEGLSQFLKEHVQDTDVFCFQEAPCESDFLWKNIFSNYREITAQKILNEKENFVQTIYVRKDICVISFEILLEEQLDCGLGIYVCVETKEGDVHICNFHGLSRPVEKLDNSNRLIQSRSLIDFLKEKEGLKVIGGDFNVLPETKSIEMFEEEGYRNLIKDFDVKTTRNRFAWERFPESKMYFSDYVFVNESVKVGNFSVIENEVSDHLPMILEINV